MTEPAEEGRLHPVVPAFGLAAEEYERGRPEYPEEVGEILAEQLGLGPGALACDLAAGTGKLTRLLVDLECGVVAVEPVEGMRAELARVLPEVDIRAGAAEAIPIDDASVDAVTVGQAFHWFDAPVALAEVHRVLKPAGGLAMVWNMRDEDTPWVAEMSRIIDWPKRTASRYQTVDWPAEVAASGRFTPLEHAEIDWEQSMTRRLLDDRVRSISYIAAAPPAERDRLAGEVLALVDDLEEPFPMPYRTHVYWCHRR
jgi:SAM-dependent methyltransferase